MNKPNRSVLSLLLIAFSIILCLLSCGPKEGDSVEIQSVEPSLQIVDSIKVDFLGNLKVVDYHEAKGLWLAIDTYTYDLLLFDISGAIRHRINKPERGSETDYGVISGASFIGDDKLLISSYMYGLTLIDFDGLFLERIALPFRPAVIPTRMDQAGIILNDGKWLVDIKGRFNPLNEWRDKYPNPLLELFDPESGSFSPVIVLPEDSKNRNFNYNWGNAFASLGERILFIAQNDPTLFVYQRAGTELSFEKSIPLQPISFFEAKREEVGDFAEDFVEGFVYRIFVNQGKVFVAYSTGISQVDFNKYNLAEDFFASYLFIDFYLAEVDLESGEVQHHILPALAYYPRAIGPSGTFLTEKNLIRSGAEDESTTFYLIQKR